MSKMRESIPIIFLNFTYCIHRLYQAKDISSLFHVDFHFLQRFFIFILFAFIYINLTLHNKAPLYEFLIVNLSQDEICLSKLISRSIMETTLLRFLDSIRDYRAYV